MKVQIFQKSRSQKVKNAVWFCFALLMGLAMKHHAQNYTFTPCGATGVNGPTQTQVSNTYTGTSLSAAVTVTNGVQTWTVPTSGIYRITAAGAKGGNSRSNIYTGAAGAQMVGDFSLTAGAVIKVLVGQIGSDGSGSSYYMGGGGGGGSYVTLSSALILAAGGGGGAGIGESGSNGFNGNPGVTTTTGAVANGTTSNANGTPGTGGNGGTASTWYGGGAGGGYSTNGGSMTSGITSYGGYSFLNNGTGGLGGFFSPASGGNGGYGGGGGAGFGGGGGGGYSGGAPGTHGGNFNGSAGGGGGSYNSGTNQSNTGGANTGNGFVIISRLSGVNIAQTTSILCNGQSNAVLTASATGGTAPYTYTWYPGGSTSQTLTGLGPGTYTCISTDASAITYTNSFTISEPTAITITVTGQSSVTCSGAGNGQITIAASGGVPAYTYSWSPSGGTSTSASGLSGGVYTVTVKDANNCIATKTANVIEPAPSAILGFATNTTVCFGQTSILIGAGALTYTWTGGATNGVAFTPVATQVYTVTGTNSSGCNGTATVLITVNPLPALAITGQSLICNGSSTTLTATGANSYTWNTSSNNNTISVTPTSNTNYTVSGTNSFNCVNSSVITVTVLNTSPAVSGSASSPTICLGGSTTLFGAGATTYSWSGGVTNGVPFSPGISGIYTVTGYNACGSGTNAVTIIVNSLPNITANANSTAVCIGSTAVLTGGGGVSYSWTGGVTNANTFFPSVTNTYTVTGTDANGCQNTASKTIIVNPLPTITANVTNSVVCLGNTTTLFGGGGVSYSWTGGVTDGSAFAPSSTSNYVVTGTDANGCQNTASKTVTVINVPAMTISATNSAVCQGNSTILQASGAMSYTWTNSVTNGVSFVPGATNTYTVYGTNSCGTTTAAITVTVFSLPAVTANATNTVACMGTPITLFGGGASTYTWTGGITDNVAFVPSSSNTYTVTGTDSHGCQNTAVKSLTVYSLPVVTASATSTAFCRGGSTTLNGGGALTYTWTNGVINNTTFSPTITTTYIVTGTDANGCQNTASKTITIYALPVVSANVSNSVICNSNSTSFYGGGAHTYTWSGGITNGAVIFPTVTATYSVTGTNTLTGCTSTNVAYATVSVNPLPTLTITASSPAVCQGQTVMLTASGANNYTWSPFIINGSPFTPGSTTNYFVTGKNTLTGCSNIAMQTISVNPLPSVWANVTNQNICYGTQIIFTGHGADTYTWSNGVIDGVPYTPSVSSNYTVIGTNTLTGCTSTNIANTGVIVNLLPTIITTVSHSAVCIGGTTSIMASGGATSYNWSGGLINGMPFTPAATSNYTVTGLNAANGCTAAVTVSILVNPLPVITVVASSTAICQGGTVTLNGAGASTYTWTGGVVNGAVISPNATSSYTVSGTNTLTGCRSMNAAQQTIIVNITPVVSSTVSASTICKGQSVIFSGSGADTYTWTNGPIDGVPFTPTQTATYSVTGNNVLTGCTSTNTQFHTVFVNLGPNITLLTSDSALCAGETCTLSSSVFTSTWSTGDASASIIISPSVTTTYTAYVIGANTCSNSAVITQQVVDCTGLDEQAFGQDVLLIYPNPTNGSFTIRGEGEMKLNIISEIGQVVKMISVNHDQVNVKDLAPGIYFVTGTKSGRVVKQKIVVTN